MIEFVFQSLCAGSSFLFALVCFLNPQKTNRSANQWLGVFVACFGLAQLTDLYRILGIDQQFYWLVALTETIHFAFGPSLYLSILYFTSPERTFKRKDLLHFIPLFLFFINALPYLINAEPYFLNRLGSTNGGSYILILLMFLSIKVQMVVYWIASYVTLLRHQKNIKLVFSSLETVNLKWLNYLLISILLGVLIWFNQQIFKIQWLKDFSAIGYLILIYLLTYFVMKQKEIFHFPLREKEQIKSVFADREPIKQERLSTAEIELLSDQLKQLMNTEKCFLNPDLELPTLASKINLTPHELSYLLNKGLHCNFFELVNSYRVEEAKRLLLSNQHNHLNILGIAYESGFNSKTTFNTAFKKVTGLSPSQFKKTQLTEIAVVSPSQN